MVLKGLKVQIKPIKEVKNMEDDGNLKQKQLVFWSWCSVSEWKASASHMQRTKKEAMQYSKNKICYSKHDGLYFPFNQA